MFNNSKYTKAYYRIVDAAKSRVTLGYTENHHIIPDSMGGTLDPDNMVRLTAREHFICHWLLIKMTSGAAYHSMLHALNGMKRMNNGQERYETKITSRVYARIKPLVAKIHSEFMTGKDFPHKRRPRSEESKQKQREKMLGRQLTPEQLARSIANRTGMKRTEEQRERMSRGMTGILKGPMSEEGKKQRSNSLVGRPKAESSTAKRAATLKQLAADGIHHSQIVLTCPHCKTQMKKLLYSRWHGDNCKMNPNKV